MRNVITTIGVQLKQRREVLGMLQPDLAELAGISVRTIQLIEQGKGNPSLDTLTKLCNSLGLELAIKIKRTENHGTL